MQTRKAGNAQGIDVSHWNGDIDWSKVAASGISFVFVKATQNAVDKKFLANVKGAKAAGLLIGAYHYIDDSTTTVEKAKAAAQLFYKAIQQAGGAKVFDLPPVMDYESNKSNLNKAQITVVAKAFLEEVQWLTGVKPIVYTYPAFIGNFVGLSNYPLWIARYSTQAPADAAGWTRWDFWQYSDGSAGGMLPSGTRKVNGINGAVDLNEYNGTITEMTKRYVPNYQENAEKEDNKLELSKYQRDTLVTALQSLLDRKTITDKTWVDKAKNGTLTLTELTWLNAILVANK